MSSAYFDINYSGLDTRSRKPKQQAKKGYSAQSGQIKLRERFNVTKKSKILKGGKGGTEKLSFQSMIPELSLTLQTYFDLKIVKEMNQVSLQVIQLMEPENNQQVPSDKAVPTEMEVKHVYDVYDRIAPHFSHTRYKPWPKIQQFLKQLPNDSIVLDVGCGNGKYMGVNPELTMIGTDRSKGLLETAQDKSDLYELFAADSLKLPFRDQICDAFISIAVIHHFSTDKLRLKAIQQMIRVTKIGGVGLIYVWAFDHGEESVSKKKFEEQDVFVPWNLSFKFEKDLENIDKTGAKINMEKRTVVYERYYHVFKEKQLDRLIDAHKELQIMDSYYDKENWACIVKRIK